MPQEKKDWDSIVKALNERAGMFIEGGTPTNLHDLKVRINDAEKRTGIKDEKKQEELKQEIVKIDDVKNNMAKQQEALTQMILMQAEQERLNSLGRISMAEAMGKRLLEKRGLFQMSREEYGQYFHTIPNNFTIKPELNQGNVGDCYAVAAIHALSRSPHFEIIVRSSMKRHPDGSWEVKIPLFSEKGRTIIITPEDITSQENKQYLHLKRKIFTAPIINIPIAIPTLDLRKKLDPVQGVEGLQVMEAAYIKSKFGIVDRSAAEGGFGDHVLMMFGGNKFQKYGIESSTTDILGRWKSQPLDELPKPLMDILDDYLLNFDPQVHIATVSTGTQSEKDPDNFIASGHAYSVTSVDKDNNTITIANPWDTSKPKTMSFDEFKKRFSSLAAVKIDINQLLLGLHLVNRTKTAA